MQILTLSELCSRGGRTKGLNLVSPWGENNPRIVPMERNPSLAFPGSQGRAQGPFALEQESENLFLEGVSN